MLYDFQFPQTIDSTNPTTGGKYGFNNQYSGHFVHLQNPEVTSIPDIEEKSSLERWEIMRKQEDEKFDKDWYLADLFEPPEDLDDILKYRLPKALNDPFTAEEQQSLRTLGNRDCTPHLRSQADLVLIDNPKDVYLNLPPLLFAILYDKITTLDSPTPESPWTVSRLSPSLSSLSPTYLPSYPEHPLKQIKIALFRRTLTYPLYRSLPLAEHVWRETIQCLKWGKRAVIRLLWGAREIFMDGDWGVFGSIFWEDYIIWGMGSKERVLTVLAGEMEKVVVDVKEIGFGLEEIHNGE